MPTLQHRSGLSPFFHHPQRASRPSHTRPILPEVPRSPCAGAKPQPPAPAPTGAHKPAPGSSREEKGLGDRPQQGPGGCGEPSGGARNSCRFLTAPAAGRPQGPQVCGGHPALSQGPRSRQAAAPAPARSDPPAPLPTNAPRPAPGSPEALPPPRRGPPHWRPFPPSPPSAGDPGSHNSRSPAGPPPARRIATGPYATSGSRRRT